jgi:hypothetical protein
MAEAQPLVRTCRGVVFLQNSRNTCGSTSGLIPSPLSVTTTSALAVDTPQDDVDAPGRVT